MTLIESVETCFKKFATFDGTARRSEYWWFFLFNFIVSMILAMIVPKISYVYSVIALLPGIAVTTRRLHDTDRSGWWQLISFVPFVGVIVMVVFLCQDSRPNRYGAAPAYAV
ncbi:DUF805 domain-containing protein [Massilia sp. CT11-108]|jgi:uncharacterized membrane protein YhaH (DUF805 family)|uniref:DUF805 domain-containing protein n=1 Tax=Massilia sp. CT11-108 TaxID=3393900 RepID=UPI0039A44023